MATCSRCGSDNPEESLFADLVDLTSRSERMDPEDVRAMLTPYYARLRAGQHLVTEGRANEAETQLTRALEFYRGVEGTAFAREAESLVRSTA